MQFARNPQARFVKMNDRRFLQAAFDVRKNDGKGFCPRLLRGEKRCGRKGRAEQVGKQSGDAMIGQELIGRKVHAERFDAGAVLRCLRNARRKRPDRDRSAAGAGFLLALVFGDKQAQRRQVQNLTPLARLGGGFCQRQTAAGALVGRMDKHLVGRVGKGQRFAGMPLLPAGFASGVGARGDGLFGKAIACRRLAAVVAVFAEAVAQFLEFGLQRVNLRLQRHDDGENRVRALFIACLKIFTGQHSYYHEIEGKKVSSPKAG